MRLIRKLGSRIKGKTLEAELVTEILKQRSESVAPSAEDLRRKAPDLAEWEISVISEAFPYTMTGLPRLSVLIEAVKYIERFGIEGDIVECGVWRGGSMLAVIRTLQRLEKIRSLWLYDTFAGMSAPSEADICYYGAAADQVFEKVASADGDSSDWCRAGLDDVEKILKNTGYPSERIHYVEGKVEDTIPEAIPDQISILRLDTDWYESTRHELEHLYERVAIGGIVIIDDYGYWKGARKAVDEFLESIPDRVFMSRIDSSARVFVKQG